MQQPDAWTRRSTDAKGVSTRSRFYLHKPFDLFRFILLLLFTSHVLVASSPSAAIMLSHLRRAATYGGATSDHLLALRTFSSAAAVSAASNSDPSLPSSPESQSMCWFLFFWSILHVSRSWFLQCRSPSSK